MGPDSRGKEIPPLDTSQFLLEWQQGGDNQGWTFSAIPPPPKKKLFCFISNLSPLEIKQKSIFKSIE